MKTVKYMVFFIIPWIIFFALFEISIRFFIKPCDDCYGTLFGRKLAPFKILYHDVPRITDDNREINNLIIDGQKITKGDLWGIRREDPLIGYVPKENTTSANGWWQSNNIGARSRHDISLKNYSQKKRILVFGESYANCSRVPQEEAWPYHLSRLSDQWEVINFGVDGYSMGQSYLRFESLRKQMDYDVALMMIVPADDLWRDINTLRCLKGWKGCAGMPRFILEKGELRLVKRPYNTREELYQDNAEVLSRHLKEHLMKYDRLYFRHKFQEPWLVGKSIIYKILARKLYIPKEFRLWEDLKSPDSEAMMISQKIFEAMENVVRKDHKGFILVILPNYQDLEYYAIDPDFQAQWNRMSSFLCKDRNVCFDLMQDLINISITELDRGYDGTHYGPKANKLIADIVWDKIIKTDTIFK